MNYNAMTDRELLHYLDLYSEDPVVRRLMHLLGNTRSSLIAELEEAGMDPKTWTFQGDYDVMFPGEYIEHLRRLARDAQDEADNLQWKLEEVREERDQLKTRSVVDLIEEVWAEKRKNSDMVRDSMATIKAYKDENEKLKEQIDMWAKMNQPERKLT